MIFLSVLVVLHHVSVGYGTMGGWCYVTPEKLTGTLQIIFSALFGLEATFSMSLFFFISAYLTIPSLEKKCKYPFSQTNSNLAFFSYETLLQIYPSHGRSPSPEDLFPASG
jgi:hypothetical protein